jgi:hypothetical protein
MNSILETKKKFRIAGLLVLRNNTQVTSRDMEALSKNAQDFLPQAFYSSESDETVIFFAYIMVANFKAILFELEGQ